MGEYFILKYDTICFKQSEAAIGGVLKILAKFTENTGDGVSFLIKLQGTSFKRRPQCRCFPVTFTGVLTTAFLQKTSGVTVN